MLTIPLRLSFLFHFQFEGERVWNWATRKVQQTEYASDVVLKNELHRSFESENPDLSRETFFLGSVTVWEMFHLTRPNPEEEEEECGISLLVILN